jgi:hypothetical protein
MGERNNMHNIQEAVWQSIVSRIVPAASYTYLNWYQVGKRFLSPADGGRQTYLNTDKNLVVVYAEAVGLIEILSGTLPKFLEELDDLGVRHEFKNDEIVAQ